MQHGDLNCQFQLANWDVQEPAPEAWSCAAGGVPVEYVSIDMIGNCNLQPYLPQSCQGHGGQELAEYYSYYAAASLPNWPIAEVINWQNRQVMGISSKQAVELQNEETNKISNNSLVSAVFEQVSDEFQADIDLMEQKMHRYPASLRDRLSPSIGPYHHHQPHLKQAEKVKHMAVISCVIESGHLAEEVYLEVAHVADNHARRLYDKDVMAGISCADFRDMMFVDACFLVQYMRMDCGIAIDESLVGFLRPNRRDIRHDLILLENQLPWKVVETVMNFMPEPAVPLTESFISVWRGYLQHHKKEEDEEDQDTTYLSTLVKHKKFKPHLLGLLRYYTVGRNTNADDDDNKREPKNLAISVSAIELAEIGVSLTANKTTKLIDMGLNYKGTVLGELSMAPLSLDRNRASFLFNMAALELCTVESFSNAPVEDSAVCSYLLLLALLVSRVEDVKELRARGLLQGGGGLTDMEAFKFFTTFQGLRFGRCYNSVMQDFELYKESRQIPSKVYAFYYKHKKIIAAVLGAIIAVSGIIGTLLSIKNNV
ncbi:hypothetical protein SORBI_3005G216700 [Sorghum bicolor]|uniref:Uncharacterized protein n=1 Tax=Sorghum bicolor TaxID=4558 RepID=A0A1Z5RJW2_SORBI|nr:hypothetical protein SORBI_3005G216700 [Sorghum bicolor]